MAYNVNSVFEGPGLEGVIAVERINLNKCKDSAQAAAIAMRGLGKKFQERADAGQVVSMVANVGAGSAGLKLRAEPPVGGGGQVLEFPVKDIVREIGAGEAA